MLNTGSQWFNILVLLLLLHWKAVTLIFVYSFNLANQRRCTKLILPVPLRAHYNNKYYDIIVNKTFSNFNTGISKDLELISSEGTVTERKFLFLKERKH